MDYIERCKQLLYSRFLYFVFPNKIIRLQANRDRLAKKIQLFIHKYIGEIEERYRMDNKDDIILENSLSIAPRISSKKKSKKVNAEVERFYINFNLMETS
jgi:hypothetical protein